LESSFELNNVGMPTQVLPDVTFSKDRLNLVVFDDVVFLENLQGVLDAGCFSCHQLYLSISALTESALKFELIFCDGALSEPHLQSSLPGDGRVVFSLLFLRF